MNTLLRRLYIAIIALTASAYSATAQQLFFEGEVSTHFDNKECSQSDCGTSRTVFAVRVTPMLGYRFADHHSVVVGTSLLKDFGSKRFIDRARLVAYYGYKDDRFAAEAGIFERNKLIGRYSRAFFSDSTLIYNNTIQGIAGHYKSKKGFVELAVDWEGLYSPSTREQFRVLASGGGNFAKYFDAGVSLSIHHYANKSTFDENVVDDVLVNPYIGAKFKAFFNFDIRLGYLQSLQRDRLLKDGWKMPCGGELEFRMERWGVFISNNFYYGKGLMPLYHHVGKDDLAYGSDLYTGDSFYGTNHRFYNRTGIGYERSFVGDRIKVYAEMVLQHDGKGLFCQQLIGISARICPTLYDKTKHDKK